MAKAEGARLVEVGKPTSYVLCYVLALDIRPLNI